MNKKNIIWLALAALGFYLVTRKKDTTSADTTSADSGGAQAPNLEPGGPVSDRVIKNDYYSQFLDPS